MNKFLVLTLLSSFVGLGHVLIAQEEKVVWLDEMDLSTMTTGWKTPQKNRSILGYPIKMNGKVYKRGVGVHAKSKFMVNLNGKGLRYIGTLGIDDRGMDMSSARIYILGDGKILWDSGIIRKKNVKTVDLDISEVQILAFYVSDAKDGQSRDYVNFANSRFITEGTVEPFIPLRKNHKILSPITNEYPKINGPSVYGVTKKAPLLYKIPVSGKKPVGYDAKNLPKGLTVDKTKGIIEGKLNKEGTYKILLEAFNELGKVQKEFEIVVGKGISLTPPMGWNSWNCWGKNIDQVKVLAAANAFIEKGLIDYGWTYVVIDDAWQGDRNNKKRRIKPNGKFPEIKKLSDKIHAKGLKFGIYSTPWITSFAGYCGTSSDSIDGYWEKEHFGNRKFIKHGAYSFEKNDVTQFENWGVDYLKYDWNPIDSAALVKMGKEIKRAERDIVFSISNSSKITDVPLYKGWCNLWRTTSDIRDIWDNGYSNGRNSQGIMDILRYHNNWQKFNNPSTWNDPDMLVLGKVGWGSPRKNNLSADELYTHFTLWCMWSAPLMLGCDLEQMDDFTLSLLKNGEVLEINQDRLGIQAQIISDNNGFLVLKKELYNGDIAIAIINKGIHYGSPIDQFQWKGQSPRKFTLLPSDIGLKGNFIVRDLWRQKDIGCLREEHSLPINHHGVVLLRLIKSM